MHPTKDDDLSSDEIKVKEMISFLTLAIWENGRDESLVPSGGFTKELATEGANGRTGTVRGEMLLSYPDSDIENRGGLSLIGCVAFEGRRKRRENARERERESHRSRLYLSLFSLPFSFSSL